MCDKQLFVMILLTTIKVRCDKTQEALKGCSNFIGKKEIQLSVFVSDADFDFCHKTNKET